MNWGSAQALLVMEGSWVGASYGREQCLSPPLSAEKITTAASIISYGKLRSENLCHACGHKKFNVTEGFLAALQELCYKNQVDGELGRFNFLKYTYAHTCIILKNNKN